jgi:hypothetical protein
MKKIFGWLTGGLVKEIGNAIDKISTSTEEKLIVKAEMQKIIENASTNAQQQVTSRWEADMKSDSFLAKNIRPLVLIFLTVVFSALAFTDGNIGGFKVAKEYIPIFQTLLVTTYGAYFVGRSYEKGITTIKKNK